MNDEFYGYPVEILSLATGESQGVPMVQMTLRLNECLDSFTLLFTQQQCVHLRDTLDNFLTDPQSHLHVPLEEQMAGNDLGAEIVPMLVRFATIAEDTEESQQLRKQLTTLKMVLTAMLLFLADADWKLFAACAGANRSQPGHARSSHAHRGTEEWQRGESGLCCCCLPQPGSARPTSRSRPRRGAGEPRTTRPCVGPYRKRWRRSQHNS